MIELSRAWHRLARRPGAAAVIALTIGAAASPLVLALGLRHQPSLATSGIVAPGQLARVSSVRRAPGAGPGTVALSRPAFERLERQVTLPLGFAGAVRATADFAIAGEVRAATVALVSDRFFDVLGVPVLLGTHPPPGSDPYVVVSEEFWRSHMDADRAVIGRVLRINDLDVPVLAVTKGAFAGLEPRAREVAWLPFSARPWFAADVPEVTVWTDPVVSVVTRLPAGATIAQLTPQLDVLGRELTLEAPDEHRGVSLVAEPLERGTGGGSDRAAAGLRTATWLLSAVLLALACVNVGGMVLARVTSREHETAVMLALGLGVRRLVAGAAIEGAILALGGLAGGVLGGAWLIEIVRVRSEGALGGALGVADLPVLLLTWALVTLALTLTPALHWRTLRVGDALASGGRMERPGARRTRSTLVTLQVCLSTVAASVALIAGQGIRQLRAIDPGFEVSGLQSVSIDLRGSVRSVEAFSAAKHALRTALLDVEGVRAAGLGLTPLLYNGAPITTRVILANGDVRSIPVDVVGPGYLDAVGARMVEGRDFLDTDERGDDVVVVNQRLAEDLWPGTTAIGRQVRFRGTRDAIVDATVVGVVSDFMTDYVGAGHRPRLFKSAMQQPFVVGHMYVRVDERLATPARLRNAVAGALPDAPTRPTVRPVSQLREESMAFLSNAFLYANLLATLAVLIAACGLYALQSFAVARRRREFGVRLAIGATRTRIATLVMRDALLTALAGCLLAIPLIIAMSPLLRLIMTGAAIHSVGLYAGIGLVVAAISLAGTLVPALLATRADPLEVIRSD